MVLEVGSGELSVVDFVGRAVATLPGSDDCEPLLAVVGDDRDGVLVRTRCRIRLDDVADGRTVGMIAVRPNTSTAGLGAMRCWRRSPRWTDRSSWPRRT